MNNQLLSAIGAAIRDPNLSAQHHDLLATLIPEVAAPTAHNHTADEMLRELFPDHVNGTNQVSDSISPRGNRNIRIRIIRTHIHAGEIHRDVLFTYWERYSPAGVLMKFAVRGPRGNFLAKYKAGQLRETVFYSGSVYNRFLYTPGTQIPERSARFTWNGDVYAGIIVYGNPPITRNCIIANVSGFHPDAQLTE